MLFLEKIIYISLHSPLIFLLLLISFSILFSLGIIILFQRIWSLEDKGYRIHGLNFSSFYLFQGILFPPLFLLTLIILRLPSLGRGWDFTGIFPYYLWLPSLVVITFSLYPYFYVFFLCLRTKIWEPWKGLVYSFYVYSLSWKAFLFLFLKLHRFSFYLLEESRGEKTSWKGKLILLLWPTSLVRRYYIWSFLFLLLGEIYLHPGKFYLLPYFSFYLLSINLLAKILSLLGGTYLYYSISLQNYLYGGDLLYPLRYKYYQSIFRQRGYPEKEWPRNFEVDSLREKEPEDYPPRKEEWVPSLQRYMYRRRGPYSLKSAYFLSFQVRWTHTQALVKEGSWIGISFFTKIRLLQALRDRNLSSISALALWHQDPFVYDWIEYLEGKKIFPVREWGKNFRDMFQIPGNVNVNGNWKNSLGQCLDVEGILRMNPPFLSRGGVNFHLAQSSKEFFDHPIISSWKRGPVNKNPDGILYLEEGDNFLSGLRGGGFFDIKRILGQKIPSNYFSQGGVLVIPSSNPLSSGEHWKNTVNIYEQRIGELKNLGKISKERHKDILENLQEIGYALEKGDWSLAKAHILWGSMEGLYSPDLNFPSLVSPGKFQRDHLTSKAKKDLAEEISKIDFLREKVNGIPPGIRGEINDEIINPKEMISLLGEIFSKYGHHFPL